MKINGGTVEIFITKSAAPPGPRTPLNDYYSDTCNAMVGKTITDGGDTYSDIRTSDEAFVAALYIKDTLRASGPVDVKKTCDHIRRLIGMPVMELVPASSNSHPKKATSGSRPKP